MKRGFTLIELLAVIIILGILALIVIPVTNNMIKNSRQKAYNQQLENIRVATKSWASENVFETPDEETPTMTKTLNFLITNGYVDKSVVDPMTEEPFINLEVYIIYKNGSLIYDIYENGKLINQDKNDINLLPKININGDVLVYVNLNEAYTDLGATSVDNNNSPLFITTVITKDNVVVDTINTSVAGTYLVSYTASSNEITNCVVRTIIIK